jgi:hypothetical protein
MRDNDLPELAGIDLEDSHFLGVVAEGGDLRFNALFALTAGHPGYAPPSAGEAHCYREGSLVLGRPSIIDWKPGRQTIIKDLDGSYDFGSIEIHRAGAGRYRFITEWFDAIIAAEQLGLRLSEAKV